MAPPLLIPDPENATIEELKQVLQVGSYETATRCTAIQMLLAGISRELVRDTLLVTNRALRKWINRFNQCGTNAKPPIGTAGSRCTCRRIRPISTL